MSRRVKSLDQVVGGISSEKLIKRGSRLETDLDFNRLSLSHKPKIKKSQAVSKNSSPSYVFLPVLGKKVENLKTEISPQQNKERIERFLMKKLVTEIYETKTSTKNKIYNDKSPKMKRNHDILHWYNNNLLMRLFKWKICQIILLFRLCSNVPVGNDW